MEQFEKIYKNIKNYVYKCSRGKVYNELDISLEKLNGLSNDIYLVRIHNKSTNEMLHEIIYRQFGEISDLVDRDLETSIIDKLSEKGLTPKIYETDGKTYRIEEYITNCECLSKSFLKEDDVIEKIIQILISYTMITGVYSYLVRSENFSKEYKIDIDPEINSVYSSKIKRIEGNMFDKCMKDMLIRAKDNFEKFSKKFKIKYKKLVDQEIFAKYEKVKNYIKNYDEIFSKIFPKNGLLVLNHNDVHRLNLLFTDEKNIIILDHEYSCLNLIGIDIVNYLIESNFDYTNNISPPYYDFTPDEIDFENYFEIFKNFLNKFELANPSVLLEERNKIKLEKMKTFKYFLRLVCVISLFWVLFSVIYLDYDMFCSQKTFSYFQHAMDRIFIFEKAFKKLSSLNNEI
jgi:thiamine kinase-like enzyme